MSLWTLVLDSLRYHWRTSAAVALAVAATTAVVTGALVVGDSMRGSLRHLLLDQLGAIDEVLVADRFFRVQLADELADSAGPDFQQYFSQAVPAIVMPATIDRPAGGETRRAAAVMVIGSDPRFWTLGHGGPEKAPARDEIVLNAPLAAELGAQSGDEVVLRIGSRSQIPADSPLGKKTETVRTRRLRVSAVIPAEGLGRFSLFPNQQVPFDAFVATQTLQDALEQPGKANAIFVAGHDRASPEPEGHETLAKLLHPSLADYGIAIERDARGYVQGTSNRMLLDPASARALHTIYGEFHPQDVFTYLANTIAGGGREIPYSTITAIDFAAEPPLGPFVTADGTAIAQLADDEIVLNTWAADDLGVKPGDTIEITYFEPESTHGRVMERKASFRLKAIADISQAAADPHLTPAMPGVTDRLSIGDWDAPFPFDATRVRKKDEDYWEKYRTTPKAFVSLAAGRKLWSSRFGETTAVRFAAPVERSAEQLAAQLRLDPVEMGFEFRPIKQVGLKAASGTTPFDGLFLGFSLFIMIASLLLVALLFRLGIEQRAREIGVLRAVGISSRRTRLALVAEALLVTLAGAIVGVVLGIGYAALMLAGLSTWWVGAIRTTFLSLYVTPTSIAIGLLAGVLVSLATVAWTLRRLGAVSVRGLLAGRAFPERATLGKPSAWPAWAALAMLVAATATGFAAMFLRGEAKAGAFLGSGSLVLAAGLVWIWACLRSGAAVSLATTGAFPVARMAVRSAGRNASRSTLSVGLIAAASFLIVALSAFRLDPVGESQGRASGSGGYDLVAQCDQAIYQDLSTQPGREDAGFSTQASRSVADAVFMPFRVRAGDDASCLNLYQTTKPRVLGASEAFIERGGFIWAAAEPTQDGESPWQLLDKPLPAEADGVPAVPVVLDFNTAMYGLHKSKLGEAIEMTDGQGRPLRLRIVGMLANSIFQGDVLMSERNFLAQFPETSGYRFFLIDSQVKSTDARSTSAASTDTVRQTLETALGDFGFDAETSAERLAKFFVVQNTYLSTFQSLGGLGLLLGTFGLATVQLRNVLERRGELALLRATGFRRGRLGRMVMAENALLLVAGLAVGVVAALVAVLPHWLAGGAAVPWVSLAVTLGLVLIIGLLAGLAAVSATLRAELIPALRQE